MTGYRGHKHLDVEWLNDGREVACRCLRCGAFSLVTGRAEAIEGALDRFERHHGRCEEKSTTGAD